MTAAAPWWLAMLLAGGIAVAAWRTGSLRTSGAVAAFVIGTAALDVQWSWGGYLIVWFVLASIMSRIGRAEKAARIGDIVAKGDQRDAWQVLANGGVFVVCAVATLGFGESLAPPFAIMLGVAAAGSLAAAGADTWATEIGTLIGGTPWSLREHRTVPPGTSGAITVAGSLGGAAGALALAGLASALRMLPWSAVGPVAIGGIAGAWADTLVGAWLQERRWCTRCELATERSIHSCGTSTVPRGGWQWLDNDAVNLVCALVGAAVASSLMLWI